MTTSREPLETYRSALLAQLAEIDHERTLPNSDQQILDQIQEATMITLAEIDELLAILECNEMEDDRGCDHCSGCVYCEEVSCFDEM